jgi:2-amino-4-hydroxy-6-hydroxymethyldihydropteridine diphosphokinase
MNRAFILLGSNIDKERNLAEAVHLLGLRCRIVAISSVYESIPVGLREQPNFLNAAVVVETLLSATELKAGPLSEIERLLKRKRKPDKNAPRTIDLDIVLFNDEVFDYHGPDGRPRHIPDPDLLRFPHAIIPVAELAPDMHHPESGELLQSIAQRLVTAAERPLVWKIVGSGKKPEFGNKKGMAPLN